MVDDRVACAIDSDKNMETKEEDTSMELEDGPPPGWHSFTPPKPSGTPHSAPPPPSALPPPPPSEMAQMVCGSCQQLLSYPKGARHVKCSPCETINLVLEAHQVGHVKCSSCTVLLMYPFGASSVRCSSCLSVTEIGVHNQRPPWSVQQGNPPMPPKAAC